MEMKIFTFSPFGENTYLLYDETKEAVILDPGCYTPEEEQALLDFINDKELILKKIVYTHCHLDHTFGARFIARLYPGISMEGHEAETAILQGTTQWAKMVGITMEQPPALTKTLKEGDILAFGSTELSILHVPGHSPGGLCYYNEKEKWIITGDVLFAGSIGRSDFPGGDHQALLKGIKEKLLPLPDDIKVYSGHGDPTTIGREKASNPFLK